MNKMNADTTKLTADQRVSSSGLAECAQSRFIGADRHPNDCFSTTQTFVAQDDIVVVYTPEVRESVALVCLLLKAYGFAYSLVPMRALSDRGFRDRLRRKVPAERIKLGKTVALVFEWETMSDNQTFRDVFRGHRPESAPDRTLHKHRP